MTSDDPNRTQPTLNQAISRAHQGERTEPRAEFRQAVVNDPTNYKAWLWLAYTAETDEEKRAALYQAHQLNPESDKVRGELLRMTDPTHTQAAAQRGAFVCYSRSDELHAVNVAEQVKAQGLSVWLDVFDVPAERDWHAAVRDALSASGVVLLIVSPNLLTNRDSLNELDVAHQRGKIVLPLMVETCDVAALKLVNQPIDFRHSPNTGLRIVYTLLGILNRRRADM